LTTEFLQENWIWMLTASVSGAALLWSVLSGRGAQAVTPAQATLLMNREDALLLDVREGNEWKSGHVPGARHVVLAQLESQLSELEKFKDHPVIVCCAAGNRSVAACGQLKKSGFGKVFSLAGGIEAWKEARLPLTTKG
jgi:rhodanese-related sulfurtransferase